MRFAAWGTAESALVICGFCRPGVVGGVSGLAAYKHRLVLKNMQCSIRVTRTYVNLS